MKGQLFSSDMIVAVFLFLAAVSAALFAWNSAIDKSVQTMQRQDMEITGTRILDILVKSPGYPIDWENKNATTIGLASYDRTIDANKLNAFLDMDYNRTKNIFGIPYDYFFRLGNYTKGINGSEAAFARRAVIFNGTQFLELMLSK